jgi:hypothetical protein
MLTYHKVVIAVGLIVFAQLLPAQPNVSRIFGRNRVMEIRSNRASDRICRRPEG